MAHHDDETAPLPDAENPAPEAKPAQGHLITGTEIEGGLNDGGLDDADAIDAIAVSSSRIAPPSPSAASGRSIGLIAAAVAGVLVIGGAVAATVGGGSGQGSGKSAAPTAGLAGQQISTGGATDGSPWVWQTGQSPGNASGPTTGSTTGTGLGAPKPSGTSSGPGTHTSGPGTPHSSSAAGAPSGAVPPPSTVGAPPTAPPPATVTLIAGPGCPNPAAGGFDAVGSGADSGWGSAGSGGWSGNGCDGSMQSMPMTGDSGNGGNHALWIFGSGTNGFASCVVSVYVPWDGKATDTGGTAAEYQVSEGSADTEVADFTVNQNSNHGQWVTLGTVGVGAGDLKLRLFDHGVDYPAGWRYGVAAARLQCTA